MDKIIVINNFEYEVAWKMYRIELNSMKFNSLEKALHITETSFI